MWPIATLQNASVIDVMVVRKFLTPGSAEAGAALPWSLPASADAKKDAHRDTNNDDDDADDNNRFRAAGIHRGIVTAAARAHSGWAHHARWLWLRTHAKEVPRVEVGGRAPTLVIVPLLLTRMSVRAPAGKQSTALPAVQPWAVKYSEEEKTYVLPALSVRVVLLMSHTSHKKPRAVAWPT